MERIVSIVRLEFGIGTGNQSQQKLLQWKSLSKYLTILKASLRTTLFETLSHPTRSHLLFSQVSFILFLHCFFLQIKEC